MTTKAKEFIAEVKSRIEKATPLAWDKDGTFYRPLTDADIEPKLVNVPMTWPDVRAYCEIRTDLEKAIKALEVAMEALAQASEQVTWVDKATDGNDVILTYGYHVEPCQQAQAKIEEILGGTNP